LKYCKILAKVIKEAKKVYYDNKITKSHNKIKTTWSIIKRVTGNKIHKDEPQSLKINNTMIKDTKHIVNAFNEHFISVAQTIIDNLNKDNNKTSINTNPLHYLDNKYSTTLKSIKCHYGSTTNITKIVKSLKFKFSHGYDEIPTIMLKASMSYIISPLTYICNQSLARGIFPDRLKYKANLQKW
jgi:hypothetical protein